MLADELRKGNERVFTDIYEITQQDLHVYALMLMKNPDKAQDLMQDTYLKIYESAHTLRDPSRFMPWAKRILYTQAMMEYRKQGKDPILVDEDKEGIFENIEEESMEYIPEEKLDRAELQRIVFDVVKVLPAEQRITMVAYYYDEMSVKEIAEMMGCSEGTVKSRLFNGRKAFKSKIEAYEQKHNIKLHSAAPLLLIGFKGFDKASAASAAEVQKTLAGITAKTGMAGKAGAAGNAGAVGNAGAAGNAGSAGNAGASGNAGAGSWGTAPGQSAYGNGTIGSIAPSTATKAVVKTAAGVSAKKVIAGVAIAALVATGGGIGIYQGLHSNEAPKKTESSQPEKEPATAKERAMKAYKEYLQKREGKITGFRVLPLGEKLDTLVYCDGDDLNSVRETGIVQYYDESRELEYLGKLSAASGNGRMYYRNGMLYAAGYLNGQDFSEYKLEDGKISAAGYTIERTPNGKRARRIQYKGPLKGAGNASSQVRKLAYVDRPVDEVVEELKSEYQKSTLTMMTNDGANRNKLY